MTNRKSSFANRHFRTARLGALVVCALALVSPLFAKSYYYPEIRTDVYLNIDGSAHVIQERTYAFSGSFSWADIDLKKQGADDIVFNALAEKTGTGWQAIRPLEVTSSDKSLYIRWGYSAEDEEKTFVLDYTVKGAVKRHADVAEFYWKVIEDEHARVRTARTTVTLPAPSPELFKVYIHAAAMPPRRLDFNAAKNVADYRTGQYPEERVCRGAGPGPGPRYSPGLRLRPAIATLRFWDRRSATSWFPRCASSCFCRSAWR